MRTVGCVPALACPARRRDWLAGLELPVEERESVDPGIRHIEFLDSEIAAVEELIAKQALESAEIKRLMTVPGSGACSPASRTTPTSSRR